MDTENEKRLKVLIDIPNQMLQEHIDKERKKDKEEEDTLREMNSNE